MNFHHHREHDEPEINLIPLIDVLLVILIFLAASTSFVKRHQINIALPQAQAQATEPAPGIELEIDRDGRFSLAGQPVGAASAAELAESLRAAASGEPDQALRINADGQSTHAQVVLAIEAARLAKLTKVQFLVQSAR